MRDHTGSRTCPVRPSQAGWLALLVLLWFVPGCYRGLPAPPTPLLTLPPPPELTPQAILIDGSALMHPLVASLAAAFQRRSPGVQIAVGDSGTRTGFAAFCSGGLVLHSALRPMDEEEAAQCRANNVSWEALTLAVDAVAVVVSAANDFAGCLNPAQLASIWRAGSVVQGWQQVNLNYPALPLVVYAPPAGTLPFVLFQERVLDGGAIRQPLYEGLPVGPESIGFLPLSQALRLAPSLRLLPLVSAASTAQGAAGECLLPDEAAAQNGSYLLARPLLLHVNLEALARPEVARFLQFVLSPEADPVIREAGLVPPSAASRWQALQRLGLSS